MLLVDGSSYLYRAFHALPDLRGPDGFPTGAIHGMVAMMKWLRERYPAEHAVCVFDAKGPTFRDAWYDQYKAHRAPMPEALQQQIEPIHEVVRHLGWPVLEVPVSVCTGLLGRVRFRPTLPFGFCSGPGDSVAPHITPPQARAIGWIGNAGLLLVVPLGL